MPETPDNTLRLDLVAGPPLPGRSGAITVSAAETPAMLGRGVAAQILLPDPAVSRRHAEITCDPVNYQWYIADLGSSLGTAINGTRIAPNTPAPLGPRDQVGIGPFLLRVHAAVDLPVSVTASLATASDDGGRIVPVPEVELGSLAQHRLDLLIDCAAHINTAADREALMSVALDTAVGGTGYTRAAGIGKIWEDGSVEILGSRSPPNADPGELRLSRSLIEASQAGRLVRLARDSTDDVTYGQSIVSLGIHSALGAPISVGDSVEAMLYLDARANDPPVAGDAAAFVQAIARIAGLALANLARKRLEVERAHLDAELNAAHEAQKLILPPMAGRAGSFEYNLHAVPGHFVAGDLFDIFQLDRDAEPGAEPDPDAPTVVFLGDVTGHGVASAITMATVQSHLRAALHYHDDPAIAVREVNRAVCTRLTDGRFVTLWLAILRPREEVLDFVDAGHGWAMIRSPGADPETVESVGLFPLGIADDARYKTERYAFPRGSRLMVFSDGVIEQTDPEDRLFGLEALFQTLAPAGSTAEDVAAVEAALAAHARTSEFSDDITFASIAEVITPEPPGAGP